MLTAHQDSRHSDALCALHVGNETVPYHPDLAVLGQAPKNLPERLRVRFLEPCLRGADYFLEESRQAKRSGDLRQFWNVVG